jgi:DNA-binding SARP family transcriptional activator
VVGNRLWWRPKPRPVPETETSSLAPVKERPGHAIALDVASICELGLVGPGRIAATRALVLHILTAPNLASRVQIFIPEPDLAILLGGQSIQRCPAAVTVMPTLDALVEEMETALQVDADSRAGGYCSGYVLVCTPHADYRHQTMLDNSSSRDIASILIGQSQLGVTASVSSGGVIVESSAAFSDVLVGRRLYSAPADDLQKLRDIFDTLDNECSSADEPADPSRKRKPLSLSVFGLPQLTLHQDDGARDITSLLTHKQQEVLVHIAVAFESGTRRESLNEAIWPDSPLSRPYNSMHNTLSLIRRVLADAAGGAVRDLVVRGSGCYRLNEEVVDIDYWQFRRAVDSGSPNDIGRIGRLEQAATIYTGDLAENVTSLWIEAPREAARRQALDALSTLVQRGPRSSLTRVLNLLEKIRQRDLYNEGIYRDVIRAQVALGHTEAARRTFLLLVKVLKELKAHPSDETVALMASLQRRASSPVSVVAS